MEVQFQIKFILFFKGNIYSEFIQPKIHHNTNENPYGDISEDSDDEEEKIEEIKKISNSKTAPVSKGRTSVSAEAYGAFNKKGAFKPKFIKKSNDQLSRITEKISQSFLFSSLSATDLQTVIGSFEEKKFKFFL